MIIGKSYQDTQDASRTVIPVNDQGKCRVFFDGKFSGFAPIPPKLFSDPAASMYGFIPAYNEA
jgi:hypothetical protein